MTTQPPPGPGEGRQDSLLHPLDELALLPPGLNPDPLEAARFVTGAGDGHTWHAVGRDHAEHDITRAAGGITTAVCSALVRVSKHGVYDRVSPPVTCEPCPACAWTVAIATSSTERELRLITPGPQAAAAVARTGADPLLAAGICRAVLAEESSPGAEHGLRHPATVQILAHATAHRPVACLLEDCADGSCDHRPPDLATDGAWQCDHPCVGAVCAACTLRAGPWAGEWEGQVMDECWVTAPCDVLRALAARYGAGLPWLRGRPQR